jgi:hypothetical protein
MDRFVRLCVITVFVSVAHYIEDRKTREEEKTYLSSAGLLIYESDSSWVYPHLLSYPFNHFSEKGCRLHHKGSCIGAAIVLEQSDHINGRINEVSLECSISAISVSPLIYCHEITRQRTLPCCRRSSSSSSDPGSGLMGIFFLYRPAEE